VGLTSASVLARIFLAGAMRGEACHRVSKQQTLQASVLRAPINYQPVGLTSASILVGAARGEASHHVIKY